MVNIIGRLIEFGTVLGISAMIALVLSHSVSGLGYGIQVSTLSAWSSFFVIPMIYYRLFHYQARGRLL
ncbi:MAG: hypothetical protein KGH87_00560 [Thaumarchaeota archaeon]|nr:hypothetical protein [Candidatus Nitrosotalea sp.]MDE1813262.1 hypothetical protein [Nitrososphaerota archaeon]MDE1838387.1 hypothetical protein [Nitrososphaerota archaeon]